MCTDGTSQAPVPCTVDSHGRSRGAPDVAVARTAAWARATMDTWGLGVLAGLIVAEFSASAWTRAAARS